MRVPGGVEGGALLRLRGEGSAGRRGGEAGDLLVRLEVRGATGGKGRRGYVDPALVHILLRLVMVCLGELACGEPCQCGWR